MKNLTTALFLVISITLAACDVTGQAASNMPVGPPPANAKAQAKVFLLKFLKDPYSARFDDVEPARVGTCGYFGPWRGWYVQLTLNAKNSFGGYTGASTHYVWFKGGRPYSVVDNLIYCPQGNMP